MYFAVSLPIPLFEPVTMTVFPLKFTFMDGQVSSKRIIRIQPTYICGEPNGGDFNPKSHEGGYNNCTAHQAEGNQHAVEKWNPKQHREWLLQRPAVRWSSLFKWLGVTDRMFEKIFLFRRGAGDRAWIFNILIGIRQSKTGSEPGDNFFLMQSIFCVKCLCIWSYVWRNRFISSSKADWNKFTKNETADWNKFTKQWKKYVFSQKQLMLKYFLA